MHILYYIFAILSFLVLGAHFMRSGEYGLMTVMVLAPLLFLLKRRWSLIILFVILIGGAYEWLSTAIQMYDIRMALAIPAGKMLSIMGGVGLFTLASGLLLLSKKMLKIYRIKKNDKAIISAFMLTAILLSIAHLKVSITLLMVERFFPSFGWLEIFILSLYAVWVTNKMLDQSVTAKWRRRIWTFFSIIFFGQLTLGLLGFETFLMTGQLHLPVPALILAGPLYRWSISIMVFLFLGSIVLLGPAWCSYLCYFGVWDDYASRGRKKPKKLTRYSQYIRIGILLVVAATAILLGIFNVPPFAAAMIGLGFGIIGIIVMIVWSRKQGAMTHCLTYCPIGLLAVVMGKISPFRIKIDDATCTDCGICRLACRYDALNLTDIKNRKPNINCTLCGDCLGKCEDGSLEYVFLNLKPRTARTLFIVIAVSVHAVFLGLGRI